MISSSTGDGHEALAWLESLGLSEQGLSLVAQQVSRAKVLSQLVATQNSLTEGERPLMIEAYRTHLLLITLDEGRTRCYLTVVAFEDELKDLSTSLKGIASARKLELDEVTAEVLKTLSDLDFSNSTLIHEMFCQGTPVIPAKPPRLKFKIKPFSKTPEYIEGEDERVNFRDLHLFQNVVTDQLVAMLLPAEKGLVGRDVFGKKIVVGNGGPTKPIRIGKGIRFEESDGYYFSEAPGMVHYEDNKIWLETTYSINGDVDLEVGNINFVNQVHVRGDVLADFSVQAGKGIEVDGSVTAAFLGAQEDVLLHGGILGQGKGRVRTEQNLSAKFFHEVVAEAAKDISIGKESLNSRLGALGKIMAKDAVVIGGKLVSLGSMRVGTLGSEMGIKTEVFLGEDFRTLNRTEQIRTTLEHLEQVVGHRGEELDEDITFWQMDRAKESRDLKNMDDLLRRLDDYRSQLQSYQTAWQEFELLNQEPTVHRSPVCWVEGLVYPGTVFYCSGETYRVKKPMKGPFMIQGVIDSKGKLSLKVDWE